MGLSDLKIKTVGYLDSVGKGNTIYMYVRDLDRLNLNEVQI